MDMVSTIVKLNVLEVLYGQKTILVCEEDNIPSSGNLKITDISGKVHYEKYSLSFPKKCFSSINIMYVYIDDSTVTIDCVVEIEGSVM